MKAKFKLSQLAAQDKITKELVHPKFGDTGIVVTLAGPTHPSWKEALKVYRNGEQNEEGNLVLLSSTIIGWDEEAMELPFSPENALEVMKAPANEWMVSFISSTVLDNTTFFL